MTLCSIEKVNIMKTNTSLLSVNRNSIRIRAVIVEKTLVKPGTIVINLKMEKTIWMVIINNIIAT